MVITMLQLVFLFFTLLTINNLWANPYHPSTLTTALRIGNKANGTSYFLCRAMLFNGIHSGKTWVDYNRCIIPYNGKEYVVGEFTIPNQLEFGHFTWTRYTKQNSNTLSTKPFLNAVAFGGKPIIIGRDVQGKALYLCQSFFRGGVEPGKTWEGYNHCNITFAGHEIISDDYRILVAI